MQYELIPPPRPLDNYIRYCWRLENETGSAQPNTLNVVADGCPGILFAQSGEVHQDGKKLPRVLLYGQSTEPAQLDLSDTFTVLGVCFYPDALKTLFGLNAFDLTDTCMDVAELPRVRDTQLFERLWQATSTNPFDILFAYLSAHLQRNDPATDPVVAQALDQIIRAGGNVSLKQLQSSLRLSERSLERRFKQNVGISPKLFARICRFQASLHQLKSRDYDKLSDIAFDSGYADQSHFTRTFKEFTGIRPEQYQQKASVLTENFPGLVAE